MVTREPCWWAAGSGWVPFGGAGAGVGAGRSISSCPDVRDGEMGRELGEREREREWGLGGAASGFPGDCCCTTRAHDSVSGAGGPPGVPCRGKTNTAASGFNPDADSGGMGGGRGGDGGGGGGGGGGDVVASTTSNLNGAAAAGGASLRNLNCWPPSASPPSRSPRFAATLSATMWTSDASSDFCGGGGDGGGDGGEAATGNAPAAAAAATHLAASAAASLAKKSSSTAVVDVARACLGM